MANILVTGGTGQIGTYVCDDLASKGHKVVIFDSRPASAPLKSNQQMAVGDVASLDDLLGVVKSQGITHVVHLAALLVFDSKQFPSRAIRVNCVGTNNVLEAARLLDIRRIVFTSSVAVYGAKKFFPSSVVSEEDYPHCPPDPYSITKLTNELMGEYYRQAYGMDVLCLRLTGAWGPGRYTGYTGQFNDFIRRAATGHRAELPVDFAYEDAKLRWLYVKEMAACIAFVCHADLKKSRTIYNVGSKIPYKALDVIEAIKAKMPEADIVYKETGEPTPISADIAGPSGLDVDCSKLYNELGFSEKMDLKDSVSDMIDFEKSRILKT